MASGQTRDVLERRQGAENSRPKHWLESVLAYPRGRGSRIALPTSKLRQNSLFRFSRIAAWLRKCGWTSWTIGAHPVRPYGTGTLVARIGRRGRSNAGERSLTPAFVAGIAALEVANPTAGQPLGLVVAARVLFNRPDQQLCFPRQLEQGLGGLVVRGGRSQTAEAGCASAQFFDWLFAWQVQTPAVANDGAAGRMSTP